MEQEGRTIDFFSCPLVGSLETVLAATEHLITIPDPEPPMTLREWKERFRHRDAGRSLP
jgi:hypothetical protein